MIQPISLTTQNRGNSFLGRESIRIIPGSKPTDLEKKIEEKLGIEPTETEVIKFANGETHVNIKEDMRGKDVYIMPVASKNVNDNLEEIRQFADAAKGMGAAKIVAFMPYFYYGRQERKTEPGESIAASLNLALLKTAGVNEVITADLHAPAVQGCNRDIILTNLDTLDEIKEYFTNKIPNLEDVVVVSPDFGGVKRAKKLAKALTVDPEKPCETAVIYKERNGHNKVSEEESKLLGNVKDKVCIIYDDMIDTAGTMANAVKLLKTNGATEVYVAACHGLFNGPAMERLSGAGVKEVVVTNTEPKPEDTKGCEVVQVDLSQKVANTILSISGEKPDISGKMLDISA